MDTKQTGMAALETEACRMGRDVARAKLHTSLLIWVRSIEWPTAIPDPEGGEPFRLVRWPRLQVMTAVGAIEITVPSFEKVGKPSMRPVEAMLGIRSSVSPLLQKRCGSIGAELPFAAAEREMAELAGIPVSRSTINRVCLELGDAAEEDQREMRMPEGFGEATRVTVQIDGGRVNTDEGWKEPRLARIEAVNAKGTKAVFLLTAIVSAEAFWTRIGGTMDRLGLAICARLAFLSDGAKWILQEAAKRYPKALCILDFYHAAEHIHEAAKAIFGEETAEAKAWARRYVKRLRRGSIDAILDAWRCASGPLGRRSASARKVIGGLISYFEERVDQVRYPRYRRRAFPIGSGQIEAAVKQVLNLRLKRNGAWWTTRNAERMLALRAAKILGRLDEVWRRRIARRCNEVPAPLVALTTSAPSPKLLVA